MCRKWRKIEVLRRNLQLDLTLCGGQSFRWRNVDSNYWIGVFRNLIWFISQDDAYISYKCIGKANNKSESGKVDTCEQEIKNNEDTDELLSSYLRLNIDLDHYYNIWGERDANFRKTAPAMFGIRVLNQEVIENLFSFICSSNNNIKRITSMVDHLCAFYGDVIAEIDGQKYYSFPNIKELTKDNVESDLRKAGFGYRAKFIYQSACAIEKLGGYHWLQNLKTLPYREARKQLMTLPGVGAKVADCICLMSLGHMESVPVDTHIFKVASDIYLPNLKGYKNLNDKVYNQIGDYFRFLHGDYAGWANTVLFCSDLKQQSKKEKQINNKG